MIQFSQIIKDTMIVFWDGIYKCNQLLTLWWDKKRTIFTYEWLSASNSSTKLLNLRVHLIIERYYLYHLRYYFTYFPQDYSRGNAHNIKCRSKPTKYNVSSLFLLFNLLSSESIHRLSQCLGFFFSYLFKEQMMKSFLVATPLCHCEILYSSQLRGFNDAYQIG